jgi:uncharacterized phage-associated protein
VTTVDDVADAIITSLGPMTPKKLEKLAYYSQAWHLAWHHITLFDDDIEAWAQGPVIRHLYDQHARQYSVHEWPSGDRRRLSPEQVGTIAWVVERYGRFTAEALSRMTHNEAPWLVARQGLPSTARSTARIDTDLMTSFYARQQVDSETAVQLAAASAALEGVELDDEWQDRLRKVADGALSVEDLVRSEIASNSDVRH